MFVEVFYEIILSPQSRWWWVLWRWTNIPLTLGAFSQVALDGGGAILKKNSSEKNLFIADNWWLLKRRFKNKFVKEFAFEWFWGRWKIYEEKKSWRKWRLKDYNRNTEEF